MNDEFGAYGFTKEEALEEIGQMEAEIERLRGGIRDLLQAIGHDRKELLDAAADRASQLLSSAEGRGAS